MWAKIITIKRTKDLNYFSLCALYLFNTRLSQFELNYWNKWTFPRHYNLLRCTCTCIRACVRKKIQQRDYFKISKQINKNLIFYIHNLLYIHRHTYRHTTESNNYFTTKTAQYFQWSWNCLCKFRRLVMLPHFISQRLDGIISMNDASIFADI